MRFFKKSPKASRASTPAPAGAPTSAGQAAGAAPGAVNAASDTNAAPAAARHGVFVVPVLPQPPVVQPAGTRRRPLPEHGTVGPAVSPSQRVTSRGDTRPELPAVGAHGGDPRDAVELAGYEQQPYRAPPAGQDQQQQQAAVQFRSASEEYNYRQLLLLQQRMQLEGGDANAAALAAFAASANPALDAGQGDRIVRFDDSMMMAPVVDTTRHHRAVVLPDSMRSASGGPQLDVVGDSSVFGEAAAAAAAAAGPSTLSADCGSHFIATANVTVNDGGRTSPSRSAGSTSAAPRSIILADRASDGGGGAATKAAIGAASEQARTAGSNKEDDKSDDRGICTTCIDGVRNVIATIVEIAGGKVAERPPPVAGDDPGGDFRALHLVLVLDNPFDSDNDEGDLLVDELSFVGVDPAAVAASDPMNPVNTAAPLGEGTANGAQQQHGGLNGSTNVPADASGDLGVATFLQDDDFLLEPDIDKSAIGAVVGAAVGAVGTVFDGARAVVRRTGKGLTTVKDVITNNKKDKRKKRKQQQKEKGYQTAAAGDVEAAEDHEPGSDGDADRSSSDASSDSEASSKRKKKEKKQSTKLKASARAAPTKYQKIIEMLLRFRARGIQVIPNDVLGTVSETDPDFDPGDPNRFHGFRLLRDRLFESPQKEELYFAIFAPRSVLLKYAEEHSLHLRTNPYSYAGGGAMAYSDALEVELAESVRRYAAAYSIADEYLCGGGNNTNANTLRLRELERKAEKKRLAKEERRRKKAEKKAAAAAAKAERRSRGLAVSSSSSSSSSSGDEAKATDANGAHAHPPQNAGVHGEGAAREQPPLHLPVDDSTAVVDVPTKASQTHHDKDDDDDANVVGASATVEDEDEVAITINSHMRATLRPPPAATPTAAPAAASTAAQGGGVDNNNGQLVAHTATKAVGANAWGFQLAAPQRTRLNMRLIREGWLFGGCGLQLDVLKSREIFVRNFFVLHNNKFQYQYKLKEWASVRYLLLHPWTVFRHDEVAIVNYFGEYVALYFVLLHEFTVMLCWPAVIGTVFGIIDDAGISREIIGALTSVLTVLWTVAWIQWWTRREAEFNATWAVDVEAEQEMVRDEYRVVDKHALAVDDIYELNFTVPLSLRRRPDGQMIELVYPHWKRLVYRYLVAYPVILLLTAGMLAAFVFNTNWRFDNVDDSDIAFASSIISNVISWVFGFIFSLIVPKLNDMENNRTQAEEENQFIIKSFFFNFFSNYFAMFIIALWPNLDGQQGVTNAARVDQMRTQMFATFITDPLVGLGQEFFLDRVFVFFRRRFDRAGNAVKGALSLLWCGCFDDMVPPARATKRQRMSFRLWQEARRQPHESTADDMLQVVIQFGYMGMFAPVFPYAFVCTLAWCIIQRAVDAGKLLDAYQRPMAHARQSLGAWNSIFLVLVVCSIITNTYFVSVLSEAPRAVGLPMDQEHKYLYFILFQYIILTAILIMVVVTRGTPDLVQRLVTRAQLLRDKAVQSRVQRTLVQNAKTAGAVAASSSGGGVSTGGSHQTNNAGGGAGGSISRRAGSNKAPPLSAAVSVSTGPVSVSRAVFGAAAFVTPDAAVGAAPGRAAMTEPFGHDDSYEHHHHGVPTAEAEHMPGYDRKYHL